MSQGALQCPIPGNTDYLMPGNFIFSVHKIPQLTFFVQTASLPDIVLGEARTENPLSEIPYPGDKINFGTLSILFMIDSKFENYRLMQEWMIGLGYPENHKQYTDFIAKQEPQLTENLKAMSDATLGILDKSNRAVATYTFIDVFPINLSPVEYSTMDTSPSPLKANATFAYSYYKILTQ